MKCHVLYSHGALLPAKEFRQILESIETDEVEKLATLYRVGQMTPNKDQLRTIENACNHFEAKLKSSLVQIRAGETHAFGIECFCLCKVIVAKGILSENKLDLAIAYIKKTMVAMSHFPQVLTKLVSTLVELACGPKQLTSKHILDLISHFSVVFDGSCDVFSDLLTQNADLRANSPKDTALISHAEAIHEARLAQAAFKQSADAWLDYLQLLSRLPGREPDAKRVLQRALTVCPDKDKLLQASTK